jgi:hypothetical protein
VSATQLAELYYIVCRSQGIWTPGLLLTHHAVLLAALLPQLAMSA